MKLKWKPKYNIESGIKIMLKNLEYWKTAPVWTLKKIKKATKIWFKLLKKTMMKKIVTIRAKTNN